MAAPPYMKLYVGDYHGDTTHLTTVEHGAYLLLLMAMWRAGGKLPRDDKRFAALTKSSPSEWAEIKPTIMEFFTVSGGSVSHKRLAAEMVKYETVVEKRSKAGKASAAKKANENNEEASTYVEHVLNTCSHNQNHNQNHLKKEKTTSSPKKGSKRCPESWFPTANDWSAGEGLTMDDAHRELEKFRDYEFKTARSDWSATFRNWLRSASERKPNGHSTPSPKRDHLDRVSAAMGVAFGGTERESGRDTPEPGFNGRMPPSEPWLIGHG